MVFSFSVNAQSPGLAIDVNMNGKDTVGKRLFIEMRLCTLKQESEKGSWFSKDTSTINFNNLTSVDFDCSKYMYNGEGKEVLNGNGQFTRYNQFTYSNQVYAWEKIIVIRITNTNPGNNQKPMFIIMPVKNKSFVTTIVFEKVPFRSNSIFYIEDATAMYKKTNLYLTANLEKYTPVPVENCHLKKWFQ